MHHLPPLLPPILPQRHHLPFPLRRHVRRRGSWHARKHRVPHAEPALPLPLFVIGRALAAPGLRVPQHQPLDLVFTDAGEEVPGNVALRAGARDNVLIPLGGGAKGRVADGARDGRVVVDDDVLLNGADGGEADG